ncbi:MAG: hypothetical protein ACYCX2_02385 [Christensenellales bacterium]
MPVVYHPCQQFSTAKACGENGIGGRMQGEKRAKKQGACGGREKAWADERRSGAKKYGEAGQKRGAPR